MPNEHSRTLLSRRRIIQASPALVSSFIGGSSVRPGQQPTSTPSRTALENVKHPGVESLSSSDYLAGSGNDESEQIQAMVEDAAANGPTRIQWNSGIVTAEQTIAPQTDGTEVIIEGGCEAAIDGTGFDGHILDLTSAPNVNIRKFRIMGSHGKRAARSLIPGNGATFEDIVLDGGAGGLEVRRSSVEVMNIRAYGHRDKTNGYAAGIHAAGDISDIQISNIEIRNCDRGVEIDDGPSRWTIEHGTIREIDNSQADDPGTPFALDCHVHAGETAIEGGIFRDILVENCQKGLTVSEHQEGLISDIIAEDIRVKHILTGAHILCEADIKVVNPTVVAREEDTNAGILIRGGAVDVSGGHISSPNWCGLATREGSRTELKQVLIDGLTVNGRGITNHLFDLSSPRGNIAIQDVTLENPQYNAIRSEKDSLGGSKPSISINNSNIVGDIQISKSGNVPISINKSTVAGDMTVPEDSEINNINHVAKI